MSIQRFHHCTVCGCMIDMHYQPATSNDQGKTWMHGTTFYRAAWDCTDLWQFDTWHAEPGSTLWCNTPPNEQEKL